MCNGNTEMASKNTSQIELANDLAHFTESGWRAAILKK